MASMTFAKRSGCWAWSLARRPCCWRAGPAVCGPGAHEHLAGFAERCPCWLRGIGPRSDPAADASSGQTPFALKPVAKRALRAAVENLHIHLRERQDGRADHVVEIQAEVFVRFAEGVTEDRHRDRLGGEIARCPLQDLIRGSSVVGIDAGGSRAMGQFDADTGDAAAGPLDLDHGIAAFQRTETTTAEADLLRAGIGDRVRGGGGDVAACRAGKGTLQAAVGRGEGAVTAGHHWDHLATTRAGEWRAAGYKNDLAGRHG